MISLTALVLAFNEEANIGRPLLAAGIYWLTVIC
jgi:hypothetical protein